MGRQGKGLVVGELGGVESDFGAALIDGKAAFGVGNTDTTGEVAPGMQSTSFDTEQGRSGLR